MNKGYKWLLGALAFTGLILLGGQSASADEPSPSNSELIHGSGSVYLNVDADEVNREVQGYVNGRSISYDDAMKQVGGLINACLREDDERGVFSGNLIRLGYAGSLQKLVVSLPITTSQREYLESLAIDTQVTVDPTIISTEELGQQSRALAEALWQAVPGTMTVWPDGWDNSIHVLLQPNGLQTMYSQVGTPENMGSTALPQITYGEVDQNRIDAVKEALRNLLPPGISAELSIDTTSGAIPEAYISGGDNINVGSAYCSTSFVVANGSNVGILTTAHCTPGVTSYQAQPVSGAAIKTGLAHGDLAVLKLSGASKSASFASGAGTSSDVTSVVLDPPLGKFICVHGEMTAYQCDTVASSNTSTSNEAGIFGSGMSIMTAQDTSPGDSGSAWFSGSTAMGVTWGLHIAYGVFYSVLGDLSGLSVAGWHVVTLSELGIA